MTIILRRLADIAYIISRGWSIYSAQPSVREPSDLAREIIVVHPDAGDIVMINGKVTIDVATTIGTGSGDVIRLGSSADMGDKTLIVAARLTVQGSILSQGKSVIDVLAGAGTEFNAAAGQWPRIHAAYGNRPSRRKCACQPAQQWL